MAPVTAVVPSAHARKGKLRRHRQHRPERRLIDEEDVKDWSKFEGNVLDLSDSVLSNLRPITMAPSFDRLTVLRLRGTNLVDIELLRSCTSLVYLDLSSNEVVELVDVSFWACFPELLVLLLHENKIMDWQAAGSLGGATQLTYLTLFSNPVSKRDVYRTFMTNRCESLRGLDLHAVSDEEVIEGSRFPKGSHFKTCSNALALPETLFKALTELNFRSMREGRAESRSRRSPKTCIEVDTDGHKNNRPTNYDASVLASILSCVILLRAFHARNSPVIIGQRFMRHHVRDSSAATRIQKNVRGWLIKIRATRELAVILRDIRKLYFIQEVLTPVQLRSLSRFRRRITRRFRLKVLITCTKSIEQFMGKVNKRFAATIACLDRAKVGGVVVTSDAVGKLVEAVSKALMAANGMSMDDANGRAEEMVTTVTTCRLIRRFSYVDIPHWPILDEDIKTDGVFITRSCTGGPPACTSCPDHSLLSIDMTMSCPVRSISGLREHRTTVRQGRRIGIFGNKRVKEFRVLRRGAAARRFHRAFVAKELEKASSLGLESPDKLWIFRPAETHMLARVLFALHNRSNGKPPIPCILELHLFRCAAATRIQGAWRGHMLRWNLLETLASCLIVARAGLCIQRWWRYLSGLGAHLRLARRLWALTSTVCTPTMYMELDVYFTLTRGWQRGSGKDGIAFIFNGGERATRVVHCDNIMPDAMDDMEVTNSGLIDCVHRRHRDPGGSIGSSTGREPPLWVEKLDVPQILASEIDKRSILRQVGPLLTKGVEAKRVTWPVGAKVATPLAPAQDPGSSCDLDVVQPSAHLDGLSESPRKDSVSRVNQTSVVGEPCTERAEGGVTIEGSQDLVDLGSRPGGLEMLELTFSTIEEAKARALLLALATEENGLTANRPIAQLMTLDMLRRAAAGGPSKAAPLVKSPPTGYQRGDAVEVSLVKRFERRGGIWLPGTINGTIGQGALYKVTLDNGWEESQVPENLLRPYDRTGKELALVEMSHLPSWWQRKARTSLTPFEALELELLRKSLPFATAARISLLRPDRLLCNNPPRDTALPSLSRADDSHLNGAAACGQDLLLAENGRALAEGPRSWSSGNTITGGGARVGFSSTKHWAGSTKIPGVKTLGGVTGRDGVGKTIPAALTVDKATYANSWVPGNRFKRGLEKLVQQAALESRQEKRERELRAKTYTVAKARLAEHPELTPRGRIERLKAAEVAVFRRESDEGQCRAALEKAMDKAERANKVLMVKDKERKCKRLSKLYMEARLAKQLADIKHLEERVDEERNKKSELLGKDLQIAKARAIQRRKERATQAIRRAECSTFTSNASQLARHVHRRETMSRKERSASGKRQWVECNKAQKEALGRKLLRRVEELQQQKRSKINRQRRILTARVKARAVMDEAVLRHRLGQQTAPVDHLGVEVMHVLRPNSRPKRQPSSPRNCDEDFEEGLGDLSPLQTEGDHCGKGGGAFGDLEYQRVASGGTDRNFPLQNENVGPINAVPSKPDGPRPRSHNRRNRRVHVKNPGNPVVVFASVPSVTAEARAKHSPGIDYGLDGFGSVQFIPSVQAPRGCEGVSRGASPVVRPDQTQLPWPMGRRWW